MGKRSDLSAVATGPVAFRQPGYVETLDDLMEKWDPDKRPIHCSNCIKAKVSGVAQSPTVKCVHEPDKAKRLYDLIRPYYPAWFRAAKDCRDFERAG